MRDAAFAIMEGKLIPGFGDSGKAHCYFSSLPLEEMANQAGVRCDLPIQIVFATTEGPGIATCLRPPPKAFSAGSRFGDRRCYILGAP